MSSLSEAEKQKLLLQQEIAKLSGAISRHASSSAHPSSYHPYARGASSTTGARSHRGRGFRSHVQSSRPVDGGWIKATSKTGNMSLMTTEKSAQLQSRPRPSSSKTIQDVSTVTISPLDRGSDTHPSVRNDLPKQHVRPRGKQYKRSGRGDANHLNPKLASTPCRYYTKTGRCNRALTCPYAHDPYRLAICPRFLRGSCPNSAGSCPLSHVPSPHNTPSCLHFQNTSACRNGDNCKYPHVRVAADAPICEAFARGGWCDQAPGTCTNLHLWECGEWREKGTCSRGAKCGLRHVLRAEEGKAALVGAGGFEDNADFVNLDQGSPAKVDSEDESDIGDETSSGESDHQTEMSVVV